MTAHALAEDTAPHAVARHMLKGQEFTCEGDRTGACRIYPICDCETWNAEHAKLDGEHAPGAQDECWVVPWVNAVEPSDSFRDYQTALLGDVLDGEVILEWDDDGVLWRYAEQQEPVYREGGIDE